MKSQHSKQQLRLSILDQSIVAKGSNAQQAVANTIATAKLADELGFHRFWISEHHNSSFIAGSAPEVLMVKLADETRDIRIGSGGIMLPNHSAFKVAENFRMLETLFPGRIDLGMGRAPGGDRVSAALLNPSNTFSEAAYLEQLSQLQHFFHDTAGTQYGPVIAVPQALTRPSQWVLSSSGGSAEIAARFGTGLAVAKFINGFADRKLIDAYRTAFQPSADLAAPEELVAVSVVCSDSEAKANKLRKFIDYTLLQFEKGNFNNLGDDDAAQAYEFTEQDRSRILANSGRVISGVVDDVKRQLEILASSMDVSEIMVSCMAPRQEDRIATFRLLAEVFQLSAPTR